MESIVTSARAGKEKAPSNAPIAPPIRRFFRVRLEKEENIVTPHNGLPCSIYNPNPLGQIVDFLSPATTSAVVA